MAESKRKPTNANFQDLTGKVFGRLTIIERSIDNAKDGSARWKCRCECGGERTVRAGNLKSGNTTTCGCLKAEIAAVGSRLSHGLSKTAEYKILMGIIKRCENTKSRYYADYGGRGISIFPAWRHDFQSFLAYVGKRPSPRHSIDRYPNNDGNYEPGNIRWATKEEQGRNKRSNRLLTLHGRTAPISEWSEETGIPSSTLRDRINSGWSHDRALTTPVCAERRPSPAPLLLLPSTAKATAAGATWEATSGSRR